MSLNKYMHPRNRYKNAKPSFLQLALKYPEFRAMTTQDESGKVFLDFKNADALRALTKYLLKEDFDLNVDLPMDRLVPTLPLRLNYIHWLEDIIGTDGNKWGTDIGTGASCIYPLLASKMNQWKFLATETDPENFYHAQKNVANNNLSHLVHVRHISDERILTSAVQSFKDTDVFDFCMCNPPFFADHMEAQGLTSTRSDDRPEAGSVSTASPQECIVAGGEVGFVRQMIEESTVLKERIRIYTSMLGKKSSLGQLKEELRHQKVAKFSTTEFCQGKTMRWGIAWTFDPSVVFPRSQFENRKAKPPLMYVIPKGSGTVEYKVHEVASYLRKLLEPIKVHCYQGKQAKSFTSITLTAAENTWCHQRRRRRQQQRKTSESQQQVAQDSKEKAEEDLEANKDNNCVQDGVEPEKLSTKKEGNGVETGEKEAVVSSTEVESPVKYTSLKRSADDSSTATKRQCTEKSQASLNLKHGSTESQSHSDNTKDCVLQNANIVNESKGISSTDITSNVIVASENDNTDSSKSLPENGINMLVNVNFSPQKNFQSEEESPKKVNFRMDLESTATKSSEELSQPKEYILKCVMRLKRADEKINLELDWLDGQSRELMHQLFTFIKNRLAQI